MKLLIKNVLSSYMKQRSCPLHMLSNNCSVISFSYSAHLMEHISRLMHDAPHNSFWISLLNEMLINKINLSKILQQATINVFSILYIATKTAVDSTHKHLGCVYRKCHCMQSNWKALTLPRTRGQTEAFLQRSECPFFHYAATLINRNAKIRLNGAIFSFAFRGHFSCLVNSSHSDGTRGFIVIIQRPGLHSLAGTCGPQLKLTPHHTPSCVAMDQQQRQGRRGYFPMVWSIREGRIHQWLLSVLSHIFCLAKPCKKYWTYCGAN